MATATATPRPVPLSAWLRPVAPRPQSRTVPGHNRWHPSIPAVAELISGGSVRLECEAAQPGGPSDPSDPVLCGPVSVVGAEPGDVVVVDVLAVGRADGRYSPTGHPGVIGCAPAAGSLTGVGTDIDPQDVLLGRLRPDDAGYGAVAEQAVPSAARGAEIGGCGVVRLTQGTRILLPVYSPGAKLSAGALHFPQDAHGACAGGVMAGWIDLRVNLTKRGVERFGITVPTPIVDQDTAA